jgi:hypothetical protein
MILQPILQNPQPIRREHLTPKRERLHQSRQPLMPRHLAQHNHIFLVQIEYALSQEISEGDPARIAEGPAHRTEGEDLVLLHR